MEKTFFIFLMILLVVLGYLPPIIPTTHKYIAIYFVTLLILARETATQNILKKEMPGKVILIFILLYVSIQLLFLYLTDSLILHGHDLFSGIKRQLVDPMISYICIFYYINSLRIARYSLWSIVFLFAGMNLLSLVLTFLEIDILLANAGEQVVGSDADRFRGIVANSNQNAYFQVFLIPFLYYFFRNARGNLIKISCLLFIGGSVIGVLMSGSRGGLLGLIVVMIGLLIIIRDFKTTLIAAFLFLLALSVFWLLSDTSHIASTIDRFQGMLFSNDLNEASNSRLNTWQRLIEIMKNDPLQLFIGRGIEAVRYLLSDGRVLKGGSHNIYLRTFIEYGLLGSLLWLAFLTRIFRATMRIKLQNDLFIKPTILISLLVVLWACMFSDLAFVIRYFPLVLGAAFSLVYYEKMEQLGLESSPINDRNFGSV